MWVMIVLLLILNMFCVYENIRNNQIRFFLRDDFNKKVELCEKILLYY